MAAGYMVHRKVELSGATENYEYYKNEHSTYRSNTELWQFTALNLHFLSLVHYYKSVLSCSFTSAFTSLILKIRKRKKLMWIYCNWYPNHFRDEKDCRWRHTSVNQLTEQSRAEKIPWDEGLSLTNTRLWALS